ncbi:hypothetical protein [Robertkochia solimangrovi]|uniref:hypothetical protein n=1 Tax=Robertkochia solimangrovi TaxID=2213046 RepID=UPI001180559C|nr:hypothetical protein [Robertkochia solimangrovi]TRZ45772.1 hypothetical protein DMZ48_00395 [Robertkochia solimangrovi]
MKKTLFYLIIVLTLLPSDIMAQCAMCRAVLESGEGQEVARGINNGIIYLMAVPYVLIGVLGFFIYKKLRQSGG